MLGYGALALGTDDAGYVAGSAYGGNNYGISVTKMNSAGQHVWTKSHHPTAGADDHSFAQGVALDGNGNVFAAGQSNIFGANSDLIAIKLSPTSPTDLDADGLLDSWELTYWPTIAGHSPNDDFDHDGLTELHELGFGLNPTLPDSSLQPAVTAEGGYLTITLTKYVGAAYEVQSAGTLLDGQPDSFSPATTTVLLDNATTLKVRDNVPLGTPPARFLRVKVTAAP